MDKARVKQELTLIRRQLRQMAMDTSHTDVNLSNELWYLQEEVEKMQGRMNRAEILDETFHRS